MSEPPLRRLQLLGAEERPRERLFSLGPSALTTEELLALLLGQGSPAAGVLEQAARLLAASGGLAALAARSPAALRGRGVGPAKAARLAAAFELGRRLAGDPGVEPSAPVRSSRELVDRYGVALRAERRETLVAVLLDARLRPRRRVALARGAAAMASFSAAELFGCVLAEAAPRFALLHNHPSGDPAPSEADRAATARVAAAALLLDLELVDHAIVGAPGRHFSFADAGLLEPWAKR